MISKTKLQKLDAIARARGIPTLAEFERMEQEASRLVLVIRVCWFSLKWNEALSASE